MHRLMKMLMVAGALLPALCCAQVAQQYRVTQVGGTLLNDLGQSAGLTQDGKLQLWDSKGVLTERQGSVWQGALNGMNSDGVVVGSAVMREYNNSEQPMIWRNGSGPQRLDVRGNSGVALDINNHGDIIGWINGLRSDGQTGAIGFLQHDGATTYYEDFMPVGLNEKGQVLGSLQSARGYAVMDNGVLTPFGYTGWPENVTIRAFNSNGYAAGSNFFHGALFTGSDLVNLWQGDTGAINDANMIVGTSEHLNAMLYDDGKIYVLDHLMTDPAWSAWTLVAAEDINNRGEILARARMEAGGYAFATLLLSPVPEPEAFMMLLAGLALLCCRPLLRRGQGVRTLVRKLAPTPTPTPMQMPTPMRIRISVRMLIAGGVLLPALASAQVAPQYQVVQVGGNVLNDLGQSAGLSADGKLQVWNRSGVLTERQGNVSQGALHDMNSDGVVVGSAVMPELNGFSQPLIWRSGAAPQRLDVKGDAGVALGINNHGDIIGTVTGIRTDGQSGNIGFLQHDGVTSYFDNFLPIALNENGQVLGSTGGYGNYAILDQGVFTPVDQSGWPATVGIRAFNSHGNFAGNSSGPYGALVAGQDFTGLWEGTADAINDANMVVGTSEYLNAMLYAGGRIYMLDHLMTDPAWSAWTLIDGIGINARGDILVTALLEGNGETYATLLLSPVPEPAMSLMLMTGLAGLALLYCRPAMRRTISSP